jgi:hypothetical protein
VAPGSKFEFDIAISFAGEQREPARAVATKLQAVGVSVFFDEFEQHRLWGEDLAAHLSEVYTNKARYCLMFVSAAYAAKAWPNYERSAATHVPFSKSGVTFCPFSSTTRVSPGFRVQLRMCVSQNWEPMASPISSSRN